MAITHGIKNRSRLHREPPPPKYCAICRKMHPDSIKDCILKVAIQDVPPYAIFNPRFFIVDPSVIEEIDLSHI